MENQASYCAPISVLGAEACKLPLLDGETNDSTEIITTEIQLNNAGIIVDLYRRDRTLFSGTACTAWAILLRCYTGQDKVTFEYATDNTIAPASLLRMSFGENQILSKYTESARDAITGIELKQNVAIQKDTAAVNAEPVSSVVNTAVCICDSGTPAGMLGTTIAGRSSEVSGPTCDRRTMVAVRLMTQSGTCHVASESSQRSSEPVVAMVELRRFVDLHPKSCGHSRPCLAATCSIVWPAVEGCRLSEPYE